MKIKEVKNQIQNKIIDYVWYGIHNKINSQWNFTTEKIWNHIQYQSSTKIYWEVNTLLGQIEEEISK